MLTENKIITDGLFAPVSFGGGGGGGGGDGGGSGASAPSVCTASDPNGDGLSWGGAAGDMAPAGQGYGEGLSMPDGSSIGGSTGPDVTFGF